MINKRRKRLNKKKIEYGTDIKIRTRNELTVTCTAQHNNNKNARWVLYVYLASGFP